MSRQRCTPIHLGAGGSVALVAEPQTGDGSSVSEADIQALVHDHPTCLPIAEIDSMFAGAVSICRELNTSAGPIDNLLVTPSGLPVLVECKLWRNPEGRREVVGQILDYAKELSRWSSADLQREVSRRLGRTGNPLLDLVRAADPSVDETQFNDALTHNLRRGRFLLLIVGDGIREGVEAIAEYLQAHAGLHFSLGLVELPVFRMGDGTRLVVPRVLARTNVITRNVIAVPEGFAVEEGDDGEIEREIDPDRAAQADAYQRFWSEFVDGLKLDDPEQPPPKAARQGHTSLSLPAPQGSCWLTVYRDQKTKEVGVMLSSHRNTAGDFAAQAIAQDWEAVSPLLGGTTRLTADKFGRPRIGDAKTVGSLDDPQARKVAFEWLAERVNVFVNVLRPRVRSAAADYEARRE